MARLGRHIGCAATQWYGWGDTLVVRRHIGIGWGDTMANGRHNGRGRGDTMANRYWGDTMAQGDTMARNSRVVVLSGAKGGLSF